MEIGGLTGFELQRLLITAVAVEKVSDFALESAKGKNV
jgi:hypothetical protein